MKNKNLLWLVLVALVVGGVYWYMQQNEKKNVGNNDEKLEVVAILPLSGEYAQYGENDKKGIDLGIRTFGLEDKVVVKYLDNKGTAKDAVSAFNKIKSEKPLLVIDDAISSITESIIPISRKNKISIISTGASNPSFSGISPYFFRVWNSDAEEGVFAAKSCKEKLNISQLNVVYLDNTYGKGLSTVFKNELSKFNISVIQEVSIPTNLNDYKNIVSKINNDYPIYFVGYGVELAKFTKLLREMSKNNQIISTVATEDKQIFDIAGNAMNGVYYVYNASVNNPEYTKFKKLYKETYNEDPKILTDVGYDVALIIKKALDNGVKNNEEFKTFLLNMQEIQGASGNIKFDKNGDVHKTMVLKQIKEKNFVVVK